MRSRLHVDTDVLETAIDCGNGRRLLLIDILHVFVAADRVFEDFGAIDGQNHGVPKLHAAHISRSRKAADIELIFAVGREQMLDDQSASRTQGQTLDVDTLIGASRRAVGVAGGLCGRTADGAAEHLACSRYVLIEKRRGDLQYAGDIIETFRFVVFGKERGRIDMQPEQVFDGIGVFGAIEAMQSHPSGIRIGRCRLVQRSLHP